MFKSHRPCPDQGSIVWNHSLPTLQTISASKDPMATKNENTLPLTATVDTSFEKAFVIRCRLPLPVLGVCLFLHIVRDQTGENRTSYRRFKPCHFFYDERVGIRSNIIVGQCFRWMFVVLNVSTALVTNWYLTSQANFRHGMLARLGNS